MFERKDSSSFPDKWIPIIHQVITDGSTLNWGHIILSNLDLQLKKDKKEHKFFMSSYLLDVMCSTREYPFLGWKWKSDLPSIHVYCKMLWENKYKEDYELICNELFSTIYHVFFCEEASCLSPEGKKLVKEYGDWYMTLDEVYIGISSSTKDPHWLPHFVPVTLLL